MKAEEIDSFLKKQGSPLAGLGHVFVAAGKKYGVDPALTVAISGAESSFGKHTYGAHNAWGWGPGKSFGNWEEAISTISKGLRSGYLNEGRNTPEKIGAKWAPSHAANDPTNLNSNWATNVNHFLNQMGVPLSSSGRTRPSPIPPPGTPPPAPRPPPSFDPSSIIMSGAGLDPGFQVRRLVDAMVSYDAKPPSRASSSLLPSSPLGPSAPSPPLKMGKVTLSPNADRAGVPIHPEVVNFVKEIAARYGKPLEIGTGTNHNQYVAGTSRQSAHWTGWAADIPAVGQALTNLGRAALITAGMPPAQARRQTGGLYNIGGKQVIFNSMIGGNHYNHLHVGFAGHRG